ncbi:MAG: tRNA (N(6)-L-threonylcarbamoyladenosine(37)-C(2))-methylthiotransferase [Archaeoglobaceae archaeon]|nr:tRNA (N(6)-L-threonylcarbamoyladenosine(37)-C(2))-methylthiotransferase [Archaeoglobaceae archaeon]MDW8014005.1 tRNA (N(6)-L-threonylcarbamoyladenosine(37)-C(2))-methylthiotransferase [Archaeoglobaceae archaeon]
MRVAIETYGCTMNQADSDIMRGLISREFELSSVEDAEVVVINSCGVIDYTERKIIRRMKELKKLGKKVVLAGCLTRISDEALKFCDSAISPDNVEKIVDAIRGAFDGFVIFRDWIDLDKASLRTLKCRIKEDSIAIVSISEGCLGKCSFCVTRFARGKLRSFSMEEIVREVEDVVKMGFKEIQLTSQDTGAYGLDKGEFLLPKLLKKIGEIDGNFRVRVGMMNPNYAKKMLEELIEAYSSEKIYKFIHLPVQSGDDEILKQMKRDHSVDDYVDVVKAFRDSFDDVLVSTDVIVGFPTEKEDSFMKTCELIKETRPDIVNITRFSPRPKTEAAKLKDIPGWIKKERSRILTEICRKISSENNSKFVGKKMRVLVTKHGKDGTMLARSNSYRPVVVKGKKIGEFTEVEIKSYTFAYLVGV